MSACTRCATEAEHGDLRCAICALPFPVEGDAADDRAGSQAKILRCRECNAAVAFDPTVQSPRCAFCTATMEIEQPIDPVETARTRVPFAVDRRAAERALARWLSTRGWFRPAALHTEAVLESLTPLCWAGWVVNARALVTWAADSDHGSRRSAWAPHSGQVTLQFDSLCIPASRGLAEHECRALVPFYDLSRAISAELVSDGEPPLIEGFDTQRSAARALVQRAIDATARTRVEPFIPGRRFRNVHVSCLLEGQTTDRIALPAWVMAYRYRGTPYRAIVHGQRAEVCIGTAPLDWRKILGLVGGVLAIAAIIALVVLLAGCGNAQTQPDATPFFDRCEPSGPFAPLTGRAAVQASLNVHVDAGGLIQVDTSSKMLLVMDLAQDGTSLGVSAQLCRVVIPDIPLAGQEMPITFQVPDTTVASIPVVAGRGALQSADQSCTELDSEPITIVVGAKIDPPDVGALPAADDDGNFTACLPSATESCVTATGSDCACDQEGDGNPGATLIARNIPAIDLDQVYVSLRTTFSLHGRVHTTDEVKGRIDATLETGILACRLVDGTPCLPMNVQLVKTLNPLISPQDDNPSTFRSVRVPDTTTCADVIANEGALFPR